MKIEIDGWTYEEKEDGLALGRQPFAPVGVIVRKNLGREQLGRTKAGKQREKEIAQEREKLKRGFGKKEAANQTKVLKVKCRPCQNRGRKCDSKRPHCGTCIERNINRRCIYDPPSDTAASLDSEKPFPPDAQPREALASIPTALSNAPNPNHTPALQTNAIINSVQGGTGGIARASQSEAPNNLSLGKKRKRVPHVEEDDDEEEEVDEWTKSRRHKRNKREAGKGNT